MPKDLDKLDRFTVAFGVVATLIVLGFIAAMTL